MQRQLIITVKLILAQISLFVNQISELPYQYKFIEEKPDGFDNLYIPGFGTTNDFSDFSAGFNYFISYYIPLYKKKAKQQEEKVKS